MNDSRRKQISKANDLIRQALDILETCREEESDYIENMPESFRNGEKGDKAQEALDAIESAIGDLENAENSLGEAQQ